MNSEKPYSILAELEQQVTGDLPPVHLWHPEKEIRMDLKITRDGEWWHEGSPIERQRLKRLFSSILRKEPDGCYFLVTPVEKCRIEVEDVPFQAILLQTEGEGRERIISLTTNMADKVVVGTGHPLRFEFDPLTEEPSPYVMVRDGLEARLARSVYYHLADLCTEEETGDGKWLGVWSSGHFFKLLEMA